MTRITTMSWADDHLAVAAVVSSSSLDEAFGGNLLLAEVPRGTQAPTRTAGLRPGGTRSGRRGHRALPHSGQRYHGLSCDLQRATITPPRGGEENPHRRSLGCEPPG